MTQDNIQPQNDFQGADIFISYSRKDYFHNGNINEGVIDNNVVLQLTDALKENGISFWMDILGINPGQEYADKIVTNIENSKIFLLILTYNANKSHDILKEIKIAVDNDKTIIPLIVDDIIPNKTIQYHLSNLNYIKCKYSLHCDFSTLILAIKKELHEQDLRHKILEAEISIQNAHKTLQEKKSEIDLLTDKINSQKKELKRLRIQLAKSGSQTISQYDNGQAHALQDNADRKNTPKYNKGKRLLYLAGCILAFSAIFIWLRHKNNNLENNLKEVIDNYSSEVKSLRPLYEDHIQGDTQASLKLGKTILDSIKNNKARQTGLLLIKKTAGQNLPEAQDLMGTMYYLGKNGCETNYDSASYWFNKAIQNNSTEALRNMGVAYAEGKYKGTHENAPKRNEAITLLRLASLKGDTKSMVNLGRLYYNTRDTFDKYPQKNEKLMEENDSSRYWMIRALEDPLITDSLRSDAEYYIGMYHYQKYLNNPTDTDNAEKALNWFKKSSNSKKPHQYSNFYIGVLYENHKKNEKMAIYYYVKAAKDSVGRAKEKLKKLGAI